MSFGPGSDMFSPLIRSDSKSGGGVVPDVKIAGGATALSAASAGRHVAQRRNAAQIDKLRAFNMALINRTKSSAWRDLEVAHVQFITFAVRRI